MTRKQPGMTAFCLGGRRFRMFSGSAARLLTCLALAVSPIPCKGEGLPKLIAHRGASANAPENTLSAFRLAWEEGADGIEGDFYLTADGEVVCIHDENTKRTAGKKLPVKDSTLAELRALEYGAWKDAKFKGEKIPLLSEVLDELPHGKWFFLEIKDSPRIVKPIAEILANKRPAKDRVIIISFNKEVIKACRETMPGYRASLLSSLDRFAKGGGPEAYLADLEWCGAQGLSYKISAPVTKDWLAKARGEDGILMAWTVDTRDAALRAVAFGTDFIGTNRPGALRSELEPAGSAQRYPTRQSGIAPAAAAP
jgi:glycerophosphoryl diester phosphodiesterase